MPFRVSKEQAEQIRRNARSSGATVEEEAPEPKKAPQSDAYQPTPSDRKRRAQGTPSLDLSPPPEKRGIAGRAEGGFLLLTGVAVLGLGILHVSPFNDFLTWGAGVMKDFAGLAGKAR